MNTRIMTVVAIVGLLPSAAAADVGRLPSGPNYSIRIAVVSSHTTGTKTVCDVLSDGYSAVIVKEGSAILTTLYVPVGTPALNPGDRFNLSGQSICNNDPDHVTLQMLPCSPPLISCRGFSPAEPMSHTSRKPRRLSPSADMKATLDPSGETEGQ